MAKTKAREHLFRKRFSLTQQDMAEYLGISASLYAMAERSWRSLPSHASKKMADMELACTEIEFAKIRKKGPSLRSLLPGLDKKINDFAGKLAAGAKYYRSKATRLEASLDKMTKKLEHDMLWSDIIDIKLSRIPAGKKTEDIQRQFLWLRKQQAVVEERILEAGHAQIKLMIQIDMLKMTAGIYEAHHGKLKTGNFYK